MKTRQGFVSNSSSSSFCIVGIPINHEEEDDFDLLKAVGFFPEDAEYGDDNLNLWPDYGVQEVQGNLLVIGSEEPDWIGIAADDWLNKDYTVAQIGAMFLTTLRDYGYECSAKPQLHYGEAGNG